MAEKPTKQKDVKYDEKIEKYRLAVQDLKKDISKNSIMLRPRKVFVGNSYDFMTETNPKIE